MILICHFLKSMPEEHELKRCIFAANQRWTFRCPLWEPKFLLRSRKVGRSSEKCQQCVSSVFGHHINRLRRNACVITPAFDEQVTVQNGRIHWKGGSYFTVCKTNITEKWSSLDKYILNLITFILYFKERIPDLHVKTWDKKTVCFFKHPINHLAEKKCNNILKRLVFEKYQAPTVIE